jgi:copper(I)-binding protein
MSLKSTLFAAAVAVTVAFPALAGTEITIEDPYARAMGRSAMAGAAFMQIMNAGDEDDRLIAARSEISERVELHTHIQNAEGVMQMVEVPEGWVIPAGASHGLERGGDHVMFMGLRQIMEHGSTVTVTLVFEKAGEITLDIPVDLQRKPMHGMQHGHGMGAGMGAGMSGN